MTIAATAPAHAPATTPIASDQYPAPAIASAIATTNADQRLDRLQGALSRELHLAVVDPERRLERVGRQHRHQHRSGRDQAPLAVHDRDHGQHRHERADAAAVISTSSVNAFWNASSWSGSCCWMYLSLIPTTLSRDSTPSETISTPHTP